MSSKDDVRLPNRKVLLTIFTMAWVGIIASVVMGIYVFFDVADYDNCDIYVCAASEIPVESGFDLRWYHPLIIFLVAVIVAVCSWERYSHYYREVVAGVIINKDTSGGGDHRLHWTVSLRGLTRAGEERIYTWSINAGCWHEVKVGQRFRVSEEYV